MTGEHTCMMLKPLKNDDIEDSGSDPLGFFGPFYQGVSTLFQNSMLLFIFLSKNLQFVV